MAGTENRDHRDPYRILGVPADASADEIARAYRRRAREVHPDLHTGRDPREFQELTEAYELVGDPVSRARYDAARATSTATQGIPVPVRVIRRAPSGSPRRQVLCGACRGRGVLGQRCRACAGAGIHLRRAGHIGFAARCPACRGRGHVIVVCTVCRGRGLTPGSPVPSGGVWHIGP